MLSQSEPDSLLSGETSSPNSGSSSRSLQDAGLSSGHREEQVLSQSGCKNSIKAHVRAGLSPFNIHMGNRSDIRQKTSIEYINYIGKLSDIHTPIGSSPFCSRASGDFGSQSNTAGGC